MVNQKSSVEITVTICYKFTSVTSCYKFYMNGSQILYRNTNVENIEPPSHIKLQNLKFHIEPALIAAKAHAQHLRYLCLRQSTCDGDKAVLITEKITRHTCARACYQILFVQMSKVWKLKRV